MRLPHPTLLLLAALTTLPGCKGETRSGGSSPALSDCTTKCFDSLGSCDGDAKFCDRACRESGYFNEVHADCESQAATLATCLNDTVDCPSGFEDASCEGQEGALQDCQDSVAVDGQAGSGGTNSPGTGGNGSGSSSGICPPGTSSSIPTTLAVDFDMNQSDPFVFYGYDEGGTKPIPKATICMQLTVQGAGSYFLEDTHAVTMTVIKGVERGGPNGYYALVTGRFSGGYEVHQQEGFPPGPYTWKLNLADTSICGLWQQEEDRLIDNVSNYVLTDDSCGPEAVACGTLEVGCGQLPPIDRITLRMMPQPVPEY
jgi:hypothetical protein